MLIKSHYREMLAVIGLFLVAGFTAQTGYRFLLVLYLLFIPFVYPKLTEISFFGANSDKDGKSLFLNPQFWLIVFCAAAISLIVFINPTLLKYSITTLFLVAIPEEWFFRGYLQRAFGNNYPAVFAVSVVFAITHGLTISWEMAALVIIPSLIFGYIFLKTQNLILVSLLHALSNLGLQAFGRFTINPAMS